MMCILVVVLVNDDGGIDDVVGFYTNRVDDANCGDGENKFHFGYDINGGDGYDKDDGDVNDDGYVESNICNDPNCGDGKSKTDYHFSGL